MPEVRSSTFGESRLRMVRIDRHGDRHDPRELIVSMRFEGEFAGAFREGTAEGVIPGETIKNIVHRAARTFDGEIESLGLTICDRVLQAHARLTLVRVEISEQRWARLEAGGKAQGQSFTSGSGERRTTAVTSNGTRVAVVSGVADLTVMRTSGFAPPPRDRDDDGLSDGLQRMLVGVLSADWTYSSPDVTFGPYRQGVRRAIVETFAWHAQHSLHHTLYAIGDVVLATYDEIADVSLSFHERPYRPADLFSAGTENPDDLFVAADEPVGVVQVTVARSSP
jgi:urate oxidase